MKKTIVNLFAGFLGVGKTTALRHLIACKPENEKWALIVNEFGEIGIDGAVLSGGEVPVAEIAGGCLCCVAGPQLTVTVANLLRRVRPDRLLIEASGLAHAAGVIDEFRQSELSEALTIGAVVTLVDPRQFVDPGYMRQPMYRDQVMLADVLVANKVDLADVPTMEAFRKQAEGLFPPKSVVAEVFRGEVDPAWLSVEAVVRRMPYRPVLSREKAAGWASHGWIFEPEAAFDGERLTAFFDALPTLVPGLARAKGVFRVMDDWVWLNWVEGHWGATRVAWRRDNRFELIAREIDDAMVEEKLRACLEVQL
jgi:G3E family GTPase